MSTNERGVFFCGGKTRPVTGDKHRIGRRKCSAIYCATFEELSSTFSAGNYVVCKSNCCSN